MKPTTKPRNPNFSSGPCAKRPGWSLEALKDAAIGRSHRSGLGKEKLKTVIEQSKAILAIPADWHVGIVPASDTGAIEMAMWNVLGERGVDVLTWESFSETWAKDCKSQLKLNNLRTLSSDYGKLPDLSAVNWDNDVVFCWNGTTSGACVPNADWIDASRKGLTICDATSAVFAMEMDWQKLDIVTWSWQKALGGEAAHGMLALSPRAVARLENYTPSWPLPKIFQLTKKGKLNEGIFRGETINTPSMLCVEDALDSLNWAESVGGLQGMIERSEANLHAITDWVERTDWIAFLTENASQRSNTSICLKIIDPWFQSLNEDEQKAFTKDMSKLLEKEGIANDINAYRDAPAGLRIWGGATVETSDIKALFPWLEWAWAELTSLKRAA